MGTEVRLARELAAKAAELDGIRINKSASDCAPHMLGSGGPNDSPISEARRRAIEYADAWARGVNPAYADFGAGHDCTNFVSQALRAGGFEDVHRSFWPVGGNSDEWFYEGPEPKWLHPQSTTWALARESHNYWTQHSGLGSIIGVQKTPRIQVGSNDTVGLPDKAHLDPLAPSKAGLIPGDIIYYKENNRDISHVALYVGQEMRNGILTDIVDQHADGKRNFHDDWMPDSKDYGGGQAEFVHLRYSGE